MSKPPPPPRYRVQWSNGFWKLFDTVAYKDLDPPFLCYAAACLALGEILVDSSP